MTEFSVLEKNFLSDTCPSKYKKEEISHKIGKNYEFVNMWFQNRRRGDQRKSLPDNDLQIEKLFQLTTTSTSAEKKSYDGLDTGPCDELVIIRAGAGKDSNSKALAVNQSERSFVSYHGYANERGRTLADGCSDMEINAQVDCYESANDMLSEDIPLYQCIVDMIALEEGVFRRQARWDTAVNASLYGIQLSCDARLVYKAETGLELVQD